MFPEQRKTWRLSGEHPFTNALGTSKERPETFQMSRRRPGVRRCFYLLSGPILFVGMISQSQSELRMSGRCHQVNKPS
jgi:hypothetical protein